MQNIQISRKGSKSLAASFFPPRLGKNPLSLTPPSPPPAAAAARPGVAARHRATTTCNTGASPATTCCSSSTNRTTTTASAPTSRPTAPHRRPPRPSQRGDVRRQLRTPAAPLPQPQVLLLLSLEKNNLKLHVLVTVETSVPLFISEFLRPSVVLYIDLLSTISCGSLVLISLFREY